LWDYAHMETLEKAHKYLGITIKMRRDFSIQARKSEDQGLHFVGQVITASGLIAGLGFTAIANIQQIYFFALGELVLIVNICVGLYFMKTAWYENLFLFRSDIRTMASIAKTLIAALTERSEEKAKNGIADLEKFASQEGNARKLFKILPEIMIMLILLSGLLILTSLIVINP